MNTTRSRVERGEIRVANCPGCGHSMYQHRDRHCIECERDGEECVALEPGIESPGG